MQLSCEMCHAALRPEDVRLDLAVATCHACNAVLDLSSRKGRELAAPAQARARLVRAKAPQPPVFRVEEDASGVRISWRWLSFIHAFLVFFCIGWDSFLFVWYGIALKMEDTPLLMIVFPVAHVAAGIGLTYYTLTGFVNRTSIDASRNHLSIRHGPLPLRANIELQGRQLVQIYGVENITKSDGQESRSYDLVAQDREGRAVKLLSSLKDKDQVLFLEQTLERCMGIEDAPVDGEVAVRTHAA